MSLNEISAGHSEYKDAVLELKKANARSERAKIQFEMLLQTSVVLIHPLHVNYLAVGMYFRSLEARAAAIVQIKTACQGDKDILDKITIEEAYPITIADARLPPDDVVDLAVSTTPRNTNRLNAVIKRVKEMHVEKESKK